jgi:hypothetical protein
MADNDRLKSMVREALGSGLTQAEVLTILATYGDKYPEYAEQVAVNDDLEIDDAPLYSYTEEGVWVSAWVFVHHPESDEDEDVQQGSTESAKPEPKANGSDK